MRSIYKKGIKSTKKTSELMSPEEANRLLDESMPTVEPVSANELNTEDIKKATEISADIDKYDNSELRTFGEGVARGALPLSDVILTKVFGIDPEEIRKRKEYNPVAATTGEITGFVAPAILTGGGSLAAKATLGGATLAAEKAGANIIANTILNQSEKRLARKIAEKMVTHGIPAAGTGAALGINTFLNEAALGEADLTGENLLSYAGTGALLNAGVAGGLGAAGELAKPVKIGVDKLTKQIKQRTSGILDLTDNFTDLVASSTGRKTALKTKLQKMKVGDPELTKLAQDLDWGLADSARTRLNKFETLKTKTVDELDNLYTKANQLAPNGVIYTDELGTSLNQTLQDYASARKVETTSPGFRSALRKAQNEIDSIARMGNTVRETINPDGTKGFEIVRSPEARWNFSDLRKRTQLFGKNADESKNAFDREINSLLDQKMRDITQSSIDLVDQSSDQIGLLSALKEQNRTYSLLRTIENHGIAQRADKNSDLLTLKDIVWGTAGVLHGGPAAAAGIVLTKKALESDMRKMFVVLGTAHKVNELYTQRVSSGLKTFFEKASQSKSRIQPVAKNALLASGLAMKNSKPPKNEKEAFKNLSENITELKINPDNLAFKIAANTMRAGYAAPNSTKFAQISLARAVNFLEQKMPKDIKSGMALFKKEFEPSSLELSKFKRYLQAIENPYSIVDELERGTLTREHIEAVSTVFPAVYERIRKEALVHVQKTPDVNYSKKVQLHILFGITTDSSLGAHSVSMLQQNFAPEQPDSGAQKSAIKPTKGGLENLKASERAQTGMQKAAQGIQD